MPVIERKITIAEWSRGDAGIRLKIDGLLTHDEWKQLKCAIDDNVERYRVTIGNILFGDLVDGREADESEQFLMIQPHQTVMRKKVVGWYQPMSGLVVSRDLVYLRDTGWCTVTDNMVGTPVKFWTAIHRREND